MAQNPSGINTPYNVCSVYWRIFSTSGVSVHWGDIMSTSGDIMSTSGDIMSTSGDIMSTLGDFMSTSGDFMSTLVEYHDACGGYHEYIAYWGMFSTLGFSN